MGGIGVFLADGRSINVEPIRTEEGASNASEWRTIMTLPIKVRLKARSEGITTLADGAIKCREMRKKLRMTQAELAREMHTTATTISRWESGVVTIPKMRLAHIRAILANEQWMRDNCMDYDRKKPGPFQMKMPDAPKSTVSCWMYRPTI